MCCICRCCRICCVKPILFLINFCYLTIGIVAALLFCLLKWGCSLLLNLNALTSLMQIYVPGGLAANVKPSDWATMLQPAFDNVAWVLLCVAIIFLALGVFGIAATCCPKWCSCLGWAYIGILSAALIAEIVFIIVWFATANARVQQAIKSGLKQQINESFQDYWQLSINNINIRALAFNFAHVQFNCCGISDTNPQSDYLGATNWNRTYQIQGSSVVRQTPFPLTCCKVNASYWPLDPDCPVKPTTLNANLDKSCYDTVYNMYIAQYVWIQWVVFVLIGFIIIAPGFLMRILVKPKAATGQYMGGESPTISETKV